MVFLPFFRITLNVVSLTGLILAFGNMIDSSIIVTDNISQYRKNGRPPDESCIKGVNEDCTHVKPIFHSHSSFCSSYFPERYGRSYFFRSGIFGYHWFIGIVRLRHNVLLPVLYKIIFSVAQFAPAAPQIKVIVNPAPGMDENRIVDRLSRRLRGYRCDSNCCVCAWCHFRQYIVW